VLEVVLGVSEARVEIPLKLLEVNVEDPDPVDKVIVVVTTGLEDEVTVVDEVSVPD
jgi:hypothetical protein